MNTRALSEMVHDEKTKITPAKMLKSRALRTQIREILNSAAAKYKRAPIRLEMVHDKNNPDIACTNKRTVFINTANVLTNQMKTIKDKYYSIIALAAHELGHILYTDFLLWQSMENSIGGGKLFPDPESGDLKGFGAALAIDDMRKFIVDPTNRKKFLFVIHQICNVIEDGYVEKRISQRFPGSFKYSLELLDQKQFELCKTAEEMWHELDDENDARGIYAMFVALILSYAKTGEIKRGGFKRGDNLILDAVFSAIEQIDRAIFSGKAMERMKACVVIMVENWMSVFKPFLETITEKETESNAGTSGTGASKIPVGETRGEEEGAGVSMCKAESGNEPFSKKWTRESSKKRKNTANN